MYREVHQRLIQKAKELEEKKSNTSEKVKLEKIIKIERSAITKTKPEKARGIPISKGEVGSILYPHVKAGERLSTWTSTFEIKRRNEPSKVISSEDRDRVKNLKLKAVEESTRNVYGAGLKRFIEFCENRNISHEHRVPASSELLGTFFTNHAGAVGRATVNNWKAGLRLWHNLQGAEWHGDSWDVNYVLKGLLKVEPESARRTKRRPVTWKHMEVLSESLNLEDSLDVAIFAAATVAFWSCCRLGELLIDNMNHFDKTHHVMRGTEILTSTTRTGKNYMSIKIPWSKTTQRKGATISISKREEKSCPYKAMEGHLTGNFRIPATAPLFAWRSKELCGWSPLTRKRFLERCNEIWKKNGLEELSGHCFRIGGASELLLRGTPVDAVAMQGRWESRAFLVYWRNVEEILPMYVTGGEESSGLDNIQKIKDSVEQWKRKQKS